MQNRDALLTVSVVVDEVKAIAVVCSTEMSLSNSKTDSS